MKDRPRKNRGKAEVARKRENFLLDRIDKLAEFEEFCRNMLPALRQDIKSNLSPAELFQKYKALAAARMINIAATEEDAGKAISAIKDILDRADGKPKESIGIENRYEKLDEDQIKSLLMTKIDDLEEDEEDLAVVQEKASNST